jgi:nitroimidazol reductase NimA-like FMN-containing flavoprotein (pyridoxamine 5'-phosphate oxidase superfamily)
MDDTQKQKLQDLLASQNVAVIATQGEHGPTATMQAFAETSSLDLLFIMGESDKYRNLTKNRAVAVIIDDRDKGEVSSFRVNRATIYGNASEVPRGAEWDSLKDRFLEKNPFEAPFFGSPALKMIRVRPHRISFAGADHKGFKVEL